MADQVRRFVDRSLLPTDFFDLNNIRDDEFFAVVPDSLISQPVATECQKLLRKMQRDCPNLLPDKPLEEGQISSPIEIDSSTFLKLTRIAIKPVAKKTIAWKKNGSEIIFLPEETVIDIQEGLILIGIVLETTQTGKQTLTVPFATGKEKRFAGTIMTTEERPRGHALLVDVWGDAVIAAAYEAVLQVISGVSAETGVDNKGQHLRAGAIIAKKGVLSIIPQAYFDFENKILAQQKTITPMSQILKERGVR